MASIITPTGQPKHRWIQFVGLDGSRKTIRLGLSNNKAAAEHKHVVEQILAAKTAGLAMSVEISKFIGGLTEQLRQRYAKSGLIEIEVAKPIAEIVLGDFLDGFFTSHAMDSKQSTMTALGHTRKRLEEYFGRKRTLSSISAADARAFRKWLSATNKRDKTKDGTPKRGLSHNTVMRRVANCKQLFRQALRDGVIPRNPFEGLPSSVRSNPERKVYIDVDTFNKVLAHAPNARWRALLVLARFGCLRVPSEIVNLKWDHIAWDAKRFSVVDSPKTAKHAKRAVRMVPLFPAIDAALTALQLEARDGAEFVFEGIRAETNLRTAFEKIIHRAGVAQWPKLWQNLRASGATDLARSLPSHVAAAICGHTEQIAREHYWQVTDTDMQAALEIDGHNPKQNPKQSEAVFGGTESHGENENCEIPRKNAVFLGSEGLSNGRYRTRNTAENTGKIGDVGLPEVKSEAFSTRTIDGSGDVHAVATDALKAIRNTQEALARIALESPARRSDLHEVVESLEAAALVLQRLGDPE